MEQAKSILNTIYVESDTLYDLIYDMIFFDAFKESEEDIKNGRVITLEELGEHIRELEARYEDNNI